MKKATKQTLLKFLAVFVLGLVLGVWVAWPRPRTPVRRMRDAVREMNEDTDAWLADLERTVGEPSANRGER